MGIINPENRLTLFWTDVTSPVSSHPLDAKMSETLTALNPEEVFVEEFTRSKAAERSKSQKRKGRILSFFNRQTKASNTESALWDSIDALEEAIKGNENEGTVDRLRNMRERAGARTRGCANARVREFLRSTDPFTWTSEDILVREPQAKGKIPSSPLDESVARPLQNENEIEPLMAAHDRLSAEIHSMESGARAPSEVEKQRVIDKTIGTAARSGCNRECSGEQDFPGAEPAGQFSRSEGERGGLLKSRSRLMGQPVSFAALGFIFFRQRHSQR